jgi:DNA topoisomerase-1
MQKVLPYDKMKLHKTLIIVESPSKCKKIEKILGCGYKVIACCGHLREIQSLSDINKYYNPKYTIISNKKKIVENIKREIHIADDVILATDNDREGEGIAWHICVLFSLPFFSTKRIKYNEITEEGILNAMKYPEVINLNCVNSQITRQMIDLMVGFTVSPLLWDNIKHSNKNHLSAGRCQTPTLKIIYDKYIENIDTCLKQVFNTTAYFTNLFISFELSKQFEKEEEVENFLESSKEFQHKCLGFKISRYIQEPPKPLTTSKMLQISPYPPKETMNILQTLYEDGFITYIRTDSKNYSNEFITLVKKYITEKYSEKYVGTNLSNVSIQSAHEPIRPTKITINKLPTSYNSKEIKIYNIIWCISLQSCMSESIYDSMDISINAPNDLTYKKNIKELIFDGWEKIKEKKQDNKEYHYLLHLKNEMIIPYKKINSTSSMIDGETYYTETSLIKKIEQLGIGRPSTYSSLVEKIKERKYVLLKDIVSEEERIMYELEKAITKTITKIEKVEKNKLIIQPLGIKVIEYIYSHFPTLFEFEYTSQMENKLDEIMEGKDTIKNICDEVYQYLSIEKEKEKEKGKEENNNNIIRIINKETSIRKSKYGEYIYYKKEKMKKPIFISLDHFEEDYLSCSEERIIEWVNIKLK